MQREISITKGTKYDIDVIAEGILVSLIPNVDLAHLSPGEKKSLEMFHTLVEREGSSYHYSNAFVAHHGNKAAGIIISYHGSEIDARLAEVASLYGCSFNSLEKGIDKDEWYIDTLAVFDEYRGRGVGSMLLDRVFSYVHYVEDIRYLSCHCLAERNASRLFYTAKGFMPERTETYYGEPYIKFRRRVTH